MRNFIITLLILLGVAGAEWFPDFNRAVEVAKREGKLVMLYFYEEGCTFCRYMEETVFVEPDVYSIMENSFVVVPVDVEDPPPDLDRRFRAVGTPTFYIYDPRQDKIVLTIFGMQEADQFIELLKTACGRSSLRAC